MQNEHQKELTQASAHIIFLACGTRGLKRQRALTYDLCKSACSFVVFLKRVRVEICITIEYACL
jgi:hypothetical protein